MMRQRFVIFSWLGVLIVLILALLLSGCETLGYGDVKIDTTRKAITVTNAELRAANLLLQDLMRGGAVAREQAQTALDSLRETHADLQKALTAIDVTGDPLTAETHRQRAARSLSVALEILAPLVAPQPGVTRQ